MNRLEKKLRETLELEIQEGAETDLMREVAELDRAVFSVTDGRANIKLKPLKGTEFRLLLSIPEDHFSSPDTRHLGYYAVSASGYIVGHSWETFQTSTKIGRLKTPARVKSHFLRMVSDPDSVLAQYVRFLVRIDT